MKNYLPIVLLFLVSFSWSFAQEDVPDLEALLPGWEFTVGSNWFGSDIINVTIDADYPINDLTKATITADVNSTNVIVFGGVKYDLFTLPELELELYGVARLGAGWLANETLDVNSKIFLNVGVGVVEYTGFTVETGLVYGGNTLYPRITVGWKTEF
jgi:hypothetical protein